ncbi:MAG: peptide deformylase, partial [Verrucomicrobia bacterium]|nr:peptide deformylase [Verrucomicrobiota bacterium]
MKKLIHTYGDPVLREKARPVEKVDEAIRALIRDMLETMRAERGVGLAAEQVGEAVAVCIIEVPLEMDRDEQGLLF